jgi:hypothetical protein
VKRLLTTGSVTLAGASTIRRLSLLLAIVAAACLGAATAHASNVRTWVSNVGTDTGNTQCSIANPCLTFAGAIANTSSGGEIDCLTPGGFGAVTITISVTIDCEATSNGGISVSGANAITINTAGIVVNLIGLDINGENTTGGIGVNITAAATVTVRNCKVYGFLINNGSSGTGILLQPTSSGGNLVVDNVLAANNTNGVAVISTSGVSNMTVRNSNINNNTAVGIYVAINGGTHAGATVEQTTLAFNGVGLEAAGAAGAVALLGGSTVVNNAAGVVAAGGTLYSFKNNQIGGNSFDGTPLTAYPGGPLN